MSGKSRTWILLGLIALIAIGVGLIAWPSIVPMTAAPTPLPIVPTAPQQSAQVPYPDVPRVTVGDARSAYESKQAVIVDVRSTGQYDQSHIAGALSIPLSELTSRLNELNKDQWIITYCT
jgi:3-mercaptopyruvate sulfurtransferase SseA